jgi:hypothetical protein
MDTDEERGREKQSTRKSSCRAHIGRNSRAKQKAERLASVKSASVCRGANPGKVFFIKINHPLTSSFKMTLDSEMDPSFRLAPHQGIDVE